MLSEQSNSYVDQQLRSFEDLVVTYGDRNLVIVIETELVRWVGTPPILCTVKTDYVAHSVDLDRGITNGYIHTLSLVPLFDNRAATRRFYASDLTKLIQDRQVFAYYGYFEGDDPLPHFQQVYLSKL